VSNGLNIARFTLHFRAQNDAVMPRHKCNVLRSAFGPAVATVLCGGNHEEHTGQLCPFARLFDGQDKERLPQLSKVPPYVFECSDTRQVINAGSTLRVVFLLIAPDRFADYNLRAVWEEMGHGLARRENEFMLERIDEEVVTESHLIAKADSNSGSSVTVRFATPLLIRKNKKSQAIREPSFADLVQFAWQRAWALGSAWGSGVPSWAPEELVSKAALVETVESDLHWIDWGRQSRRQGRTVEMGGVLGHATFQGDLAPFLPLLAFISVVHLGAGVTTGNGKLTL
jgi:hypothetical protein